MWGINEINCAGEDDEKIDRHCVNTIFLSFISLIARDKLFSYSTKIVHNRTDI